MPASAAGYPGEVVIPDTHCRSHRARARRNRGSIDHGSRARRGLRLVRRRAASRLSGRRRRSAESAGRERPGRCRPTRSSSRAYGAWYRPHEGRFTGLGDRAAPAPPRPARKSPRPDRARRARSSTSEPATASLLDALAAARAGGRSGSSAHSERADVREAEIVGPRRRLGRDRVLALARAPARARCEAGARPPRALAPGGVVVVAMPNPASLQARAFGDRWLALDLPRHLVHVPAPALLARLRELGLRAAPGQLPARRAGRLRLAPRPRRRAALPPRPLRRDPQARRRGASRCRRRSGRLDARRGGSGPPGRRAAAPSPRSAAAPRRDGLRGGAPWLRRCARSSAATPAPTRSKTIVVMPALNAAKTLELHVRLDPAGRRRRGDPRRRPVDRRDAARSRARLDVSVVWHPHNVGYGGNQKTCYLEALQREADIVVMLHPDGQYEPELIPQHDRADPRRGGRPRPRLAHAGRGRGEGGRDAALQATRQPLPDRRSRTACCGTRADRSAHRLPRLQPRAAADRAVPAELARLQLRLRAAHAGFALRLPDRGGPGAHAATSRMPPRWASAPRRSTA